MDGDDSSALFQIGFEIFPVGSFDVPGFLGMEDEDIGGGELFFCRKGVGAGCLGTPFVE